MNDNGKVVEYYSMNNKPDSAEKLAFKRSKNDMTVNIF